MRARGGGDNKNQEEQKMMGHRTENIYNRCNITSEGDLRAAARKLDAAAGVPAPDRQSASRSSTRKRKRPVPLEKAPAFLCKSV